MSSITKDVPDGSASAFAAWTKFHQSGTVYNAVGYGEDSIEALATVEPGDHLYLLDFCFPFERLKWISEKLKPGLVIICDHHETREADASKALFELPEFGGYYDTDHSGAVLSWKWFHSGPVPKLFLHVEDRDLWRFKLPGTREIIAGLWSVPPAFEDWFKYVHDAGSELPRLWERGSILLEAQQRDVQRQADYCYWRTIGGYKVPVVNSPYLPSETCHYLLDKFPDVPFAAQYNDEGPGSQRWHVRSRTGGFNVIPVAKMYGGGGHHSAAGFHTDRLTMAGIESKIEGAVRSGFDLTSLFQPNGLKCTLCGKPQIITPSGATCVAYDHGGAPGE